MADSPCCILKCRTPWWQPGERAGRFSPRGCGSRPRTWSGKPACSTVRTSDPRRCSTSVGHPGSSWTGRSRNTCWSSRKGSAGKARTTNHHPTTTEPGLPGRRPVSTTHSAQAQQQAPGLVRVRARERALGQAQGRAQVRARQRRERSRWWISSVIREAVNWRVVKKFPGSQTIKWQGWFFSLSSLENVSELPKLRFTFSIIMMIFKVRWL